ncbi:MAG: hypothetical protein HC809_11735 [Gammaproteobacteria bacterium]|nr:hypothetical protein [Gammaproteobacteria bacterium]
MFEFVYGASAMSERMIGIPVATHAHLFGALAGTAVGVWFRWRQRAAVNTR